AARAALNLAPKTPALLNNLAWLLERYHASNPAALDEAEKLIRTALKIVPDDPNMLDTLACILRRANKLSEARDTYVECIKMLPGDSPAQSRTLLELAEISQALQDRAQASKYVEAATQREGTRPTLSPDEQERLRKLVAALNPG